MSGEEGALRLPAKVETWRAGTEWGLLEMVERLTRWWCFPAALAPFVASSGPFIVPQLPWALTGRHRLERLLRMGPCAWTAESDMAVGSIKEREAGRENVPGMVDNDGSK